MRIFGLETEYAILYQPDDPVDSATVPSFSLIEKVLFESILHGRKAARSSGIKGGYFLENGGLVHLEIFLREQADTPILEVATPECSNPWDLLSYQRAFDRILTTASDRSWKLFRQKGYHGRIGFGKNNLDSMGVGYGSHENYLVHSRPRWSEKLLAILASPFLLALLIPWLLILFVVVLLFLLMLSTAYLLKKGVPVFWLKVSALAMKFIGRVPKSFFDGLRVFYFGLTSSCLFPLFLGYTVLLRRVAYRPFFKNLTPFLVTRQIFGGSGRLNPRTGRFELSQRAELTTSVCGLIMFGRRKTMFDLKGFLYHPLSLLQNRRKLTLSMGDSNLSDLPSLLKFGTTALIMEMIEAGVEFPDLRLKKPVNAFRQVSREGAWKEIQTKNGRAMTAIDIQREYLQRARNYFSKLPPNEFDCHKVLDLWEEILNQLADDPGTLVSRIDWASKKGLLDKAILPRANWKTFSGWCQVFAKMPLPLFKKARTFEEALYGSKPLAGWRLSRELQRHGLDPAQFASMRELYHQCRKIDLRYHEIGCDPGYQRQLEAEGLMERWADEEAVQRATREPPPDTRARVRSYYIKLSSSPDSIHANWEEVHIPGTSRVIQLSDPFYSRIPTD